MSKTRKSASAVLLNFILPFGMLFTGVACGADKQNDSFSFNQAEIQQQVSGWMDGIMQNKNVPVDEVKKLYQLEYKVLDFPTDTSPKKIAGSLNELGRARWDCFHAQEQRVTRRNDTAESRIIFYCKRPVETPLRYVPRSIIGR